MSWDEQPVTATCPTCGVDVTPWRRDVELDWSDDAERQAGILAVAQITHRVEAHWVDVHVGDLVRYLVPWRGLILASGVYRVAGIYEPDQSASRRRYWLTERAKWRTEGSGYASGDCWPRGDDGRPVLFEVVEAAQTDLLDLLAQLDAEVAA